MLREHEHVTRRELNEAIAATNERMDALEASQAQNQASIDQETAAVQALGPKLDTIKSEVDALKAAQSSGQSLDFSSLDAAVAALSGQADADVADAAPPAPPAPTPPAPSA